MEQNGSKLRTEDGVKSPGLHLARI